MIQWTSKASDTQGNHVTSVYIVSQENLVMLVWAPLIDFPTWLHSKSLPSCLFQLAGLDSTLLRSVSHQRPKKSPPCKAFLYLGYRVPNRDLPAEPNWPQKPPTSPQGERKAKIKKRGGEAGWTEARVGSDFPVQHSSSPRPPGPRKYSNTVILKYSLLQRIKCDKTFFIS